MTLMFAEWLARLGPNPESDLDRLAHQPMERLSRLICEEMDEQSAIVVLMALPTEVSEKIFRELPDRRAEAFTEMAATMGPLDPARRRRALRDAAGRLEGP